MKVFYRLSDNGYKKPKLPNATKENCLSNFIYHWNSLEEHADEITIFVDRINPDTREWLVTFDSIADGTIKLVEIDCGSSAKSWRYVRDEALKLPDDEFVYFVEDDYFHVWESREKLLDVKDRADYITLYDCIDKYFPPTVYRNGIPGNPLIDESGSDVTRVILAEKTEQHWRLTNSTTMTFAAKVKTLREDKDIWDKWTEGTHPHDFQAFLELREKGRTLISPIPTLSTHCEPAWLAPCVDWSEIEIGL